METNIIYNEDNHEGMKRIPDRSVNVILTDPPYLYLKNQKLDRPFDEQFFFSECKRVLKDDGFIVLFGRGESFYRWNTRLSDLGFKFKEEVIWDKRRITSPVIAIGRRHETISIHTKRGGVINNVKVNFFEKHKFEPEKIARTVERLATTFGNRKTFDLLKNYYESGAKEYQKSVDSKFNVTRSKDSNVNMNRTIVFAVGLEDRVKEQTIIQAASDHYNTIHPTQKPTNLLERLLALVSKEGDIILDPFSGSASTAVACINTNRQFIGFEIDKEYYDLSIKRLNEIQPSLFNSKKVS